MVEAIVRVNHFDRLRTAYLSHTNNYLVAKYFMRRDCSHDWPVAVPSGNSVANVVVQNFGVLSLEWAPKR